MDDDCLYRYRDYCLCGDDLGRKYLSACPGGDIALLGRMSMSNTLKYGGHHHQGLYRG